MHDKINTSRGLRGGLGEFAMLTPRWGNVQEILHFEPTLVHRAKKEQLFLHFLYFQGRRCKICENKPCILYKAGLTSAFQKPFVQEIQCGEQYLVPLCKNK